MKVSDYVAEFVSNHVSRIYGVCGAGAMHLNDSFYNHPKLNVISMQHEQAATFAAEADSRVTNKLSVVSVTAGPGGTNAITGVATAYVDSIPMLVIAGQVTTGTMVPGNSKLRQVGMNEIDMVSVMKPVTKYATTVLKGEAIKYVLEDAVYTATHERKGPVFIEIPLDVQAAEIDPDTLPGCDSTIFPTTPELMLEAWATEVQNELIKAKRPVVIIGNGLRLSDGIVEFRRIFDTAGIPIVSSWGAADIMPTEHPYYYGRCGIFGDRVANFAVQSADLILAIGTRLSVAQIGHASHLFAPKAKKIIVDIDLNEVYFKPTIKADIGISCDAKEFLGRLGPVYLHNSWSSRCRQMKMKYHSEWKQPTTGISSYGFVQRLTDELEDNAIVVTDVGFCFIPTFQTMRLRSGQRLIHSAGVSPMGWGIPAAIGAAFATDKKRQVICLTGDGGAMMNLQELQTIAHHKLPIAIFVYENDGYATMKIAQNNHFKREVMSGPRSGLSLPDFTKIAKAFGIVVREFNSLNLLAHSLESLLDTASQVPVMIVMHMDPAEIIAPRVVAKTENGKFVPTDIADMWPYLPREEFASNMNPKTHGVVSDVVERFDGQ